MLSLALTYGESRVSMQPTRGGASQLNSDGKDNRQDYCIPISATAITRGEDGAHIDETDAMGEKSRIDNELFEMEKKSCCCVSDQVCKDAGREARSRTECCGSGCGCNGCGVGVSLIARSALGLRPQRALSQRTCSVVAADWLEARSRSTSFPSRSLMMRSCCMKVQYTLVLHVGSSSHTKSPDW